ncbi:MAG TPA: hypothetical protein VIH31_02695 [Candidatus Paceibacterota bacterium]
MRGEIAYKILDALADRAMEAADFIDVFLSVGYGASFSKFDYEHSKRADRRLEHQVGREHKRKLQKYISKLKSDGFVSENTYGQILLSGKGQEKLSKFKGRLNVNKNNYQKEPGTELIIVSYDIPKEFNRERDILRDLMKLLGFKIIHQSVWVGKVKLPKQFIIDLENMGILEYVEIMEVTKKGSLKNIY